MKKKTIAIIATAPVAVKIHLETLIEYLKKDYSVVVMTNLSNKEDEFIQYLPSDVRLVDTKMERGISLFKDLRTLAILILNLRKEKINISLSITPKAGLLAGLASFVLGIPSRVHVFTGQVWITKKGFLRYFLMFLDRLIYICCTKVLVDSNSQRDFLIESKVLKTKKSLVLGSGSFCGVNTDRFCPNIESRKLIRSKHRVSLDAVIFLYVGRLTKDKGIFELLEAFSELKKDRKDLNLWLLGPSEEDIHTIEEVIKFPYRDSIMVLPYTPNPELYMAAADIFCLPSYREGFGTVVIESAACGIPSIGTRIYGLTDAIKEGITGLLIDVNDVSGLRNAMKKLLDNKILRDEMGKSSRIRAIEEFNQDKVIKRLINFLDDEFKKTQYTP